MLIELTRPDGQKFMTEATDLKKRKALPDGVSQYRLKNGTYIECMESWAQVTELEYKARENVGRVPDKTYGEGDPEANEINRKLGKGKMVDEEDPTKSDYDC